MHVQAFLTLAPPTVAPCPFTVASLTVAVQLQTFAALGANSDGQPACALPPTPHTVAKGDPALQRGHQQTDQEQINATILLRLGDLPMACISILLISVHVKLLLLSAFAMAHN